MSLCAIFSAFVVEMSLGVISNSLALMTDGIHALLDCVVTAVLLIAAKMAVKPPDAEHTYGHGKMESLGGMMGGIAILIIACFFIYESLHRMQSPPPAVLPGMLAIAGGLYAIGIDIFRIIILQRSLKQSSPSPSKDRGFTEGGYDGIGGGTTVRADLYHAVMDLGSTSVAIMGIAFAYSGAYQGDFVAALVLGGLLAVLSIRLVYRTALDLTDIISPSLVLYVRKITSSTDGVVRTGPILMRRAGDTIFADITISLRGDTSFERAHEISANVEQNIADRVPGSEVTVHFEPDWSGVPFNTRILDLARTVKGVRGAHNVNTHNMRGKVYADLHVMVDRKMDLTSAHAISETIEKEIKRQMPEIEHTTIHLEPFVEVPENFDLEDRMLNKRIRMILDRYPQVRSTGRIVSLIFEDSFKIEIDCSFDGSLSIETVHGLISEIERTISLDLDNAVITIHPEPAV